MGQQANTTSASESAWTDRLPDMVRREPAKAVVCAALLVVCTTMALRTFVFTAAPATAQAAPGAKDAPLRPETQDAALIAENTSRAARADKLESWLQRPFEGPGRNLFEFRPENYQSISRAGAVASDVQPIVADSERFWDRLAKSITSRADLRRQRQIRSDNVAAAAGKLRLQSTMIQGGTPRAMIDGRMFRVGESISVEAPAAKEGGAVKSTFRVVRIGRQSVVVERDGIRVELSMKPTDKVRLLGEDEQ
jgi:hypothetical protein